METFLIVAVVSFAGLIFLALLVGGFLVVRDTIRGEGRWGMNFKVPKCPKCNSQLPTVRIPKSWREALWGGNTCERCGCEVDKWGKEIIPAVLPVRRAHSDDDEYYERDR